MISPSLSFLDSLLDIIQRLGVALSAYNFSFLSCITMFIRSDLQITSRLAYSQ